MSWNWAGTGRVAIPLFKIDVSMSVSVSDLVPNFPETEWSRELEIWEGIWNSMLVDT